MVGSRRVPHFQLVVGGQWSENGRAFGLAIGAIPSKRAPEAALRLSSRYVAERLDGETFRAWVERVGKKTIRAAIEDLTQVPPYEVDPSHYSDWGDPREYTIGDMGIGECAGEVVAAAQMGLAASEREVFEAQLLLDQGEPRAAALRAYSAMLVAARALTREKNANLGEDPGEIVSEFRTELVDTKLFHDPFAGAKFAHYLFKVHSEGINGVSSEEAHHLIEEAQLFVDAAHQCYARLGAVAP
jgi:sulfite reductase (ferredoxin)